MIEGCDERAHVWHESQQRAKKPHKCGECGRAIAVGELYWRVWAVSSDGPFKGKWCEHCNIAKRWLWVNCGGSLLAGVAEDIHEHVEEYRRPDLARLDVGMRRRWRAFRREGLLPVPRMPKPLELGEARAL
jgi:hypothetical protein